TIFSRDWSSDVCSSDLSGSLSLVVFFHALAGPAGAQLRVDPTLEPQHELADEEPRQTGERIVLGVGEQKVLSAEGVRGFSEGTRGVVDVRLTRAGDQFVLVGQKEGETTLLLIMHDGT